MLLSCHRFTSMENETNNNKRKRRPAGTPDPDAEVVSLSPRTLLESDRYVCEICNQGFQRDQNLQMHRRRHKVPWKLLKRETPVVKKRVFVCPEPTCLHHDPCHALGDLVGIKKHFRRKHSNHKQWVCDKCSKGYAVQSDYKAHLKTCGTRGHSCDCGRVFSRVESFIEHQDTCNMGGLRPASHSLQPVCLSRTTSSPSPSSDTNLSASLWPPLTIQNPKDHHTNFLSPPTNTNRSNNNSRHHNLELQLLTEPPPVNTSASSKSNEQEDHSTQLQLSIGSSNHIEKNNIISSNIKTYVSTFSQSSRIKEETQEQMRIAMAENGYAEEARQQAKRQIEIAEQEFANAKRIRQQAQVELNKALALKRHATTQINSTILQITCHSCKKQFQARAMAVAARDEALSFVSSALTEGEVENDWK
ncbi:hypothetical protein LguiA_027799 [Lonicera macranthoides]